MSEQLDRLIRNIEPCCQEGIVLGFSGGTDSALLLAVLSLLRRKKMFQAAAVMMYSPFQKESELQEAKILAEQYSVPFTVRHYDPLSIPEIRFNSRERCYFCKKHFFSGILAFAAENGMKYVFDGTNIDDFEKYRPGQKAIRELGIRSPLAESGFSKSDVRAVSRELGLITAEKPASPCLATRFDYGMELTPEKIQKVSEGEETIRRFLPDAEEIRLRVENDSARIEVSSDRVPALLEQKDLIIPVLQAAGFEKITIDPSGYRSGSFDNFSTDGLKK